MSPRLFATLLAAGTLSVACGASKPQDTKPPAPADAPPAAADTAPAAASTAKPDATLDKQDLAEKAPHDDPNEREGHIVLTPLVPKNTPKSKFPKAMIKDQECLREIPWTGNHQADFKTIVDKCGTPTGMLEYVKPAEGRLHAKLDKRDSFKLNVNKNMCYRYFAVADDGIKDIDIIVLKKGAMLAMDKTEHPVAVIDSDKLWCVDSDEELEFSIEIDGKGAGGYTFGVWTRPGT